MRKSILVISTLGALLVPLEVAAQTNYGLSNLALDDMKQIGDSPMGIEKFVGFVYFVFFLCLVTAIILAIKHTLKCKSKIVDVNLNPASKIQTYEKIGMGLFFVAVILFTYFAIQIQPALYIRPSKVSYSYDRLLVYCLFFFGIGLVMTLWGLMQRFEFRHDPVKIAKAKRLFIRRGLIIMSLSVTYLLIMGAIGAFILQYYIIGPEF